MSRDPLQTVTLPILVESDTPDGCWVFYPKGGGERHINVRIVDPNEVRLNWRKILRGKRRDLFEGLDTLARAYESRDEWEVEKGMQRLRPFIPVIPGTVIVEDWSDGKTWDNVRWWYSSLMSTALQDAQLVMWWTKEGASPSAPAVFCPDLATAAFALRFAGGIRICPKCKMPFVRRDGKMEYCSAKHGVAYRTARSRRKAKLTTA